MNAEQVIDKILNEARAESERLLAEARDKARRQRETLEQEISAYDEESRRLADAAAEDQKERMLAAARMEVKKQRLAAKVQILDELFDKARHKVNTLSDEAYRALMMKLLAQAVVSGDEELIVGPNEKRLDGEFVKQANRQLAAQGKGSLRLADRRGHLQGGFILQRGSIRVNASTDTLIGQLREEMEPQIANELFPDES